MQKQSTKKKGFVVISMVLILLFVTLGISAAASFLSLNESKASEAFVRSEKAFFLSQACLENSLLEIKRNPLFAKEKLLLPEGECQLAISSQGENYTIEASFMGDGGYRRPVVAQAKMLDGKLEIISWGE